mmetsp:Transcript_32359/g.63281  ORF Transcript_32359/g.63281 Transcript_32359/m.63281 type:complete len:526 (+) Transcript_32359:37-1614(+)
MPAKRKAEEKSQDGSKKAKEAEEEFVRESCPTHQAHRRTLRFAVSVSASLTYPSRQLVGGHAIGEGYWFTFSGQDSVSKEDVEALQKCVDSLIKSDEAVTKTFKPFAEALEHFEANKQVYAARLLKTTVQESVNLVQCKGQMRLALNDLFPSMGKLSTSGYASNLQLYRNGFVAYYGKNYTDHPPIGDSIADHVRWGCDYNIRSLGDLNQHSVDKGGDGRQEFVLQAEFRQEQKLTQIAAMIHARNQDKDSSNHVRVLCIAGPTSSGKTTFAHKLSIYLQNYGYPSKPLTVDHYYLSLADQPRFIASGGDRSAVDYDSIEAMDVPLVNKHINQLIAGETVNTPIYCFKSGNRTGGVPFQLDPTGILVCEGIHALNPDYTAGLSPKNVFKIYISPLSGLQVDDFNTLKTTNHRLLRRMTRDYLFRGHSASRTLHMWSNVRRGEHRYIFAHQNNADFVMNSACEYEVAVLKTFTYPLLKCVTPADPHFQRAKELIKMLDFIAPWPERPVPATSVFREFIGDGAFDKH